MTRPTNLSLLTVAGRSFERVPFCLYEQALSDRNNRFHYNDREIWSLCSLCDKITGVPSVEFYDLDGFVYSYSIPRISAEFDLLKISDKLTLNIELKSQSPGQDKIQKQLVRNRHFLKHLSDKIECFSYNASDEILYHLEGTRIVESSFEELVSVMKSFDTYFEGNFDSKFSSSDYLISPITDTEAFLNGAYYLNGLQEEARRRILKGLQASKPSYVAGITGLPGTGKTLVLFDVALEYSRLTQKPVCIIHCGALQPVHVAFNEAQTNMEIVDLFTFETTDFSKYSAVFLDEAQRLPQKSFDLLFDRIEERELPCVISFDLNQVLTNEQAKNDLAASLQNRFQSFEHFKLDTKVRTNNEVWSFVRGFFDLKRAKRGSLQGKVKIVYAESIEQASYIVEDFHRRNYQFIRHGGLGDNPKAIGWMTDTGIGTTDAIGLEYEKVIMTVGKYAWYDQSGKLQTLNDESNDYMYTKALFQGITRARENLVLVVVDNRELFVKLIEAFY